MTNKQLKKIHCYRGDHAACWGYRIHFPMAHLAKNCSDYKIEVSGYIDPKENGDFNLAVFQRQYNPQVFEFMMKIKKKGVKTVYEIDDNLFNVPDWNPAYKYFKSKEVQDNIKYFISNVDAVWTTTDVLKEVYSKYNNNVYVLPNSIDYLQLFPSPNNSVKRSIVWQGSTSHKNDVMLIKPAIQELAKDKSIMIKMWDYDLKIDGVYRVPYVTYQCFYQMFSQLDGYIGLAPLTTAPFNKYKSALKFLEYTAHNMVTIASKFSPYGEVIEDGVNGLLVEDNKDWYDKIRYLLDNKEVYDKLLVNAKYLISEKYDMSKNWVLWKNAIEEILNA